MNQTPCAVCRSLATRLFQAGVPSHNLDDRTYAVLDQMNKTYMRRKTTVFFASFATDQTIDVIRRTGLLSCTVENTINFLSEHLIPTSVLKIMCTFIKRENKWDFTQDMTSLRSASRHAPEHLFVFFDDSNLADKMQGRTTRYWTWYNELKNELAAEVRRDDVYMDTCVRACRAVTRDFPEYRGMFQMFQGPRCRHLPEMPIEDALRFARRFDILNRNLKIYLPTPYLYILERKDALMCMAMWMANRAKRRQPFLDTHILMLIGKFI